MAKAKTRKPKTHKVARDSGTGEFVPSSVAKRHPKTTTVETVPNRKKKRRKKV